MENQKILPHKCKINKTVMVDMYPNQYYDIKVKILERMEQSWVDNFQVEKITQVLEEILEEKDYAQYNVVFAMNPSYNVM